MQLISWIFRHPSGQQETVRQGLINKQVIFRQVQAIKQVEQHPESVAFDSKPQDNYSQECQSLQGRWVFLNNKNRPVAVGNDSAEEGNVDEGRVVDQGKDSFDE